MNSNKTFRSDLNAMRALAVSVVVLFHFKFPGFSGGFLGVDIFFVISGYLMTKIIVGDMQRDRFGYFSFVAMRIARIWPALICLVLVLLALGYFFLPPLDYTELAKQARSAVLFYSNEEFKEGLGYFQAGKDERWLLHTWSLSVEWQFYMVYPLFLMAIRWGLGHAASDPEALKNRILWGLVAVASASFAYSLWATSANQVSAFFSLFTRMWEMLGGGIVYLTESRFSGVSSKSRGRVQGAAFAGLLAIVFVAGVDDWEAKWPGIWAIFPVGLTMVAMASGSGSGLLQRGLDWSPVQKLGLWSYSIYLWHWPIVIALNVSELHPPLMAYMKFLKVAGMAASVALGYLSYSFVEQRFRYRKERPAWQKSVVMAAAGTVVAVTGAIAIVQSDGWMARTGNDLAIYREFSEMRAKPLIPLRCQNSRVVRENLAACELHAASAASKTLVIGDSHAQHLYAWFDANVQTPTDFFTTSGCPPVPGYNRVGGKFHCDQYVDEALRRANLPEYSTVVIAGNWSGVPKLCRVVGERCVLDMAGAPKMNALVQANASAWRQLVERGKKVIVIEQTPMSDFNVFKAAMRRHFLGMDPMTSFKDVQALGPGKEYIDRVLETVPRSPSLRRVAFRADFCAGATCRIFDAGSDMPVLIDRDHLAPWWIVKNGDALRKALLQP